MLLSLNQQPRLKGETRPKEEWENIYMYGFIGGLFLLAAGMTVVPDTKYVNCHVWIVQNATQLPADM